MPPLPKHGAADVPDLSSAGFGSAAPWDRLRLSVDALRRSDRGALTIRGSGPFAAAGAANPGAPALLLQIAVASAIFMIYSVSVVLEGRKLTESRLRQIVTLHALVDENSRDAILLADINGRRSYASAACNVWWNGHPMNLQRSELSIWCIRMIFRKHKWCCASCLQAPREP